MSQNEKRQNFAQNNSWLTLEIYVKANHPKLLQGLDELLKLNLISDRQVKKICHYNFSCSLPEIKPLSVTPETKKIVPETLNKVSESEKPNIIMQLWQSFLDELSIRWLLFLGIFLVVISSGVLAASQWDNFPRFGQYFILLIYTCSFWGFGFWAKRQNNLTLTSQTLTTIAILLIPINFWAISQFGLGSNIVEWMTIVIALIFLTSIVYLQSRVNKKDYNKFFIPIFLCLSYLHLAWSLSPLPTISIYGGILGIALIHYRFLLPKQQYPIVNLLFLFAAWSLLLARGLISSMAGGYFTKYNLAIALLGWLLATIYLTLERKHRLIETEASNTVKFLSRIWQFLSIMLLSLTWMLSVILGILDSEIFFWQTVVISVLALHLFSHRLTLYWRKRDLTAIFLIGLQTLYISKELIPANFRSEALNLSVAISKTEYFPESVFGVTLFPYVIIFVLVATWLYHRQKHHLALYTEWLTLLLGVGLTCLSLYNPTWRSLNLIFSTLTLGYVAKIRQPMRISLIYFAHLLGLIAIINGINVIFTNLSQVIYGCILTALTVIEWVIYLNLAKKPCRDTSQNIPTTSIFKFSVIKSCWYFGLLLAVISYSYFLFQIPTNPNPITFRWGLCWLSIPGMLTLVGKYTRSIQQRRLATLLSCTTLITAQLLVFGQIETRIISLVIAIGLMLANAYHLRRTIVTVIHLGFGLSLIPSVLYGYVTGANWLVVGALVILALYQLRQYLQHTLDTPQLSYFSQRNNYGILGVGIEEKNFKLIKKYIKVSDYWAIFLLFIIIAVLSAIYLNILDSQIYSQYLLTTILITTAIIWRYRKQPNNLVLYVVAWLIELLIDGLITTTGGNSLTLAIVNIILGLFSLGFIGWLAVISQSWGKLNLAPIPLMYAVLGIVWRLSYFNTYTGLLTLGTAIILFNINLESAKINRITQYIAFAGISLGIYELVIYQMQLSSGGSAADGLTILALITAAIAFIYRFTGWYHRHQATIFGLLLPQFILIAHIHWAISSILKILAASMAIENANPRLTPISIATSFCLGAYAVIQGRDNARNKEIKLLTSPAASSPLTISNNKSEHHHTLSDWWVYVGLVEIAATLVYSRLIIIQLSFFDPWRVIFTCAVALAIYQIPWQNFGWQVTPWQHTALIIPALMALVTAEDISYLSLCFTIVFYLRIAYHQKNIRWSYVSLGFLNWVIIRLVWQYNTEIIWLAGIISLSILYIAQFDLYLQSQRQQRHYLRLVGTSILCVVALFYQDIGIIPSIISFILIFSGLGLKIRAFLFTGTITLILTVIYQLIILVLTYSFLKWIFGLLAGICSIVIAAGFEKQREKLTNKLQNQTQKLKNWQ